MARQNINIGSSANDGTGDPLRTAFDKINDNFVELYGTDDDSKTLANNLDVNGHNIISTRSNEDIRILPAGTGGVIASAVRIAGTTISSDDSSTININEGLVVDGTLNVAGATTITGATTLSTSLALATGATVTGIDNGALGSSATLLATQGAIKTYVDSQVTAQDLDLAGDSGTGAVDLDSQSLTIAGGTGLTSVAGSQTVTLNIDSTVATLTDSQTLTNKVLTNPTINAATMTGAVAINGITLNDNTIIANASNSDLELDGSGTGAVKVLADATVVGTLTTADITNTNNITTTQLDADGVRLKDNKITTFSSNANLELAANGTGVVDVKSAMTTVGQTITGNVVIDGRFDIDNLAFTGNNITATNSNGAILINPNGTGSITLGGNTVNVPSILSAHTVYVDRELLMGPIAKIKPSVTNDDVVIESNGTGSVVLEEVSITGNTITTHNSNADLQIDTDGTGTIQLLTNTNVSGSLTATSLTTNEITSNGSNADINITPQGTGVAAISNLKVDGNIQINDNKIATTVSNSNLQLGANGSGKVELMSNTISRTGDIIFDVTDDLIFDAGGKDIIFRYNGVQFGLFTASGSDLLIQSGTTTALTFSGANAAFSGDVSVAGAFTGSRQTISGPGAINLTTLFTEITTTGADAFSLANGTVGQIKIITMAVDGGDATITPTTFANGTSITMDAVHDSVTLIYGANGWVVLASQNITINA